MRIMTKIQYDAICDIVTDLQNENKAQREKIRKMNQDIQKLKEQNMRLRYLLEDEFKADSIDFPNTTVYPDLRDPDNKIY